MRITSHSTRRPVEWHVIPAPRPRDPAPTPGPSFDASRSSRALLAEASHHRPSRPSPVRTPGVARRTAAIYTLGAAGLLALLFAWEHGTYPNYAEGVYLFSSRLIADGAVPYRDFVAAHPPLLFYSGAGVLRLAGRIDAIRIALSLVSLATGGLVAACVWRLTASAPAAVAGGVL